MLSPKYLILIGLLQRWLLCAMRCAQLHIFKVAKHIAAVVVTVVAIITCSIV